MSREEEVELENVREENKELEYDEETDFGGEHDSSSRLHQFNRTFEDDINTPLLQEEETGNVWDKIKKKYPNFNELDSLFSARLDKDGNIIVQLTSQKNAVWHSLFKKNGELNRSLPKKIKESLGSSAEEIEQEKYVQEKTGMDVTFNDLQMQNEELKLKLKETEDNMVMQSNDYDKLLNQNKKYSSTISAFNEIQTEQREKIRKSTSPQEKKELEIKIKDKQKEIENLEKEQGKLKKEIRKGQEGTRKGEEEIRRLNEQIEEIENSKEKITIKGEEVFSKLTMRNKVKYIFKKYGLTATAILTSVGVVITEIVLNLTSGLKSVLKGLGNGLKAIAKKLAAILPGMIGAIASFIFKTAGEALGFLAKNAWLIILFVVTYAVEQYGKKK